MANSEKVYLNRSHFAIIARPGGSVCSVKFSPGCFSTNAKNSCSSLAISYADLSVRIIPIECDTEEHEVILEHPTVFPEKNEEASTSITWNDKGDKFATGTLDGTIRIWDRKGLLQKFDVHSHPITLLLWHKNIIFSSSAIGSTSMTNMLTGNIVHFQLPTALVVLAEWVDDSSVVVVTKASSVVLLHADSTTPTRTFEGHTGNIKDMKFHIRSEYFATCADDKLILIWRSYTEVPYIKIEQEKEVHSLSWSSQFNRSGEVYLLAAASSDNVVCIWDVEYKEKKYILDYGSRVTHVSFSPVSNLFLASACADGMISVGMPQNHVSLSEYIHDQGAITSLGWTENCHMLAAGTTDGKVIVVDLTPVRYLQI